MKIPSLHTLGFFLVIGAFCSLSLCACTEDFKPSSLEEQEDLADWLDSHASKEEIVEIVKKSSHYQLVFSGGKTMVLGFNSTPLLLSTTEGLWEICGEETALRAGDIGSPIGDDVQVDVLGNGNWSINGEDSGVKAGKASGEATAFQWVKEVSGGLKLISTSGKERVVPFAAAYYLSEISVPHYLKKEYTRTINKVEEVSGSQGVSFLYATDLHYSAKGSGYDEALLRTGVRHIYDVMARFTYEMDMSFMCAGGDYMQLPKKAEGQTKEMGMQNLEELNQWMNKLNCVSYPIMGNHEYIYSGSGDSYGLTFGEFYELTGKKYCREFAIQGTSHERVFYYDDVENQVRYLLVNSYTEHYATGLIKAVGEVAASTPKGYSLVAFNHYSCNRKKDTIYLGVDKCLDAIKASGVDFVAWIGGHVHADWSMVYNNMLVISCIGSGALSMNKAGDGNLYEHKEGKMSESAFSVFTIRKDKGELYCTRFGAGTDRVFHYSPKNGIVGEVH